MSDSPWFSRFFDERYLRLYGPRLPIARFEREARALMKLANLHPPARVLDLACGHGRHSVAFAMAGFEVVGLDPSPIFVAEARRYAAEVGILVDFVEGDMRSLTYDREFDAVLNLFTAFGYFDTDADDMAVLRGVARALKPGGVFCQEMAYRETILRHYQSSAVTQRQDGSFELELRAFDQRTSRNYSRSVLIHPDGRRDEGTFTLRLYTLTELVAMYEAAGMTVHAYYGDFDGRPLTMDSRLLLIGRKPEGGPPPAAR